MICRRIAWIDDAGSKRFSKLIIALAQPMMIVGALISKEFSVELLKEGLFYTLIGFLIHPLMALFALLVGKLYRDENERKISTFSTIFTNCGFIGFPILEALFGAKGLFLAAFFNISFHLFIWSWGVAILARKRSDIKLTVRKIFINLGSVPCLIGVLIYMLVIPFPGFALPAFLSKFFLYLSNLCTPISVLITGALLATRTPKQIFGSGKIYYFSAMKLLVLPLIVCVICKLIGLPQDMTLFVTVEAALPAASSITMFSEIYGLNSGYASQTVGTSSLLSVGTLPLVLLVAQWIVSL
jgi:predicted permease